MSTSKMIAALSLLFLVGCQKSAKQGDVSAENLVVQSPEANRQIGDGENSFIILGNKTFSDGVKENRIRLASDKAAARFLDSLGARQEVAAPNDDVPPVTGVGEPREGSLILGYPVGLLNENQIFGGVITKVSDRKSSDLGRLKLTDLDPMHVRTVLAKDGEKYFLVLEGCVTACTENSPLVSLIAIPIVGVEETKGVILLDLAPLGEGMNLVEILDPQGQYTKLKPKSSKVAAFDYSLSTLVFDVEATMVPLEPVAGAPEVETNFTTRWYLRLGSASNPAFASRPATEGVGFFMTARSANPKIQRFSSAPIDSVGTPPVKYFVKNVPNEFKAAFAASFDEWNEHFVALNGRKLLAYEFVDVDDPRNALLVPGDVRYNIVEWDLVNDAPYGGLGPSLANQHTGQNLTANVLVQGPRIVQIYKTWFETGERVQDMVETGHLAEAEAMLNKMLNNIDKKFAAKTKYELSLGNLKFNVRSQMENLEDPLFRREDFFPIPSGFTFETYMSGYFHDLLGHELGHNLGLRHNFRGNLSAEAVPAKGNVSHSIMEYLNRSFRHLSNVNTYDVMALKYGYLGVAPDKLGMFCTDEDVPSVDAPIGSAECSRDDATADPFGYFDGQVAMAVNKLIARGSTAASTWTVAEMAPELDNMVNNMALYAATADATASKWTNFFTGGERPADPSGVKSYVITKLKAHLCDASLATELAAKATPEAKEKTEANIKALRAKVKALVAPVGVITAEALECSAE